MLHDHRAGTTRRKRIPAKVVREVLRLKRDVYPDFSVKHFHEFLLSKHTLTIGSTWTKRLLQEAGHVPSQARAGDGRHVAVPGCLDASVG
jgi:hypothetical protein